MYRTNRSMVPRHQFYEQAMFGGALGDEPSYGSRLLSVLATGAIGAAVAYKVAESVPDKKPAMVGGAVAAIAANAIAQSIVPMSGVFYWIRAIMVPAGGGALVGWYLNKQWTESLKEITTARLSAEGRI